MFEFITTVEAETGRKAVLSERVYRLTISREKVRLGKSLVHPLTAGSQEAKAQGVPSWEILQLLLLLFTRSLPLKRTALH